MGTLMERTVGHTLAIEAHVLGSGEPGSLDALICIKYGKESMNFPRIYGVSVDRGIAAVHRGGRHDEQPPLADRPLESARA